MIAIRNRRLTALLVATVAAVGACGAEEEAPLRLMGNVGVTVNDGVSPPGEAGFNFPTDTMLEDDRSAQTDGSIAGHCEIESSGDAWKLELSVRRVGALDDGLRGYTLIVADARVGRKAADVVVDLGGNVYKSGNGCFAELTVISPTSGAVSLTLDCNGLVSEETEAFQVSTTTALEISGCQTIRARR